MYGAIYFRKASKKFIGYEVRNEDPYCKEFDLNDMDFTNVTFQQPSLSADIQDVNGSIISLVEESCWPYWALSIVGYPAYVALWNYDCSNGLYKLPEAFIAMTIVEMMVVSVLSFVFCTVSYWMCGLYAGAAEYLTFWAMCLINGWCAASFGAFNASFTQDVRRIQSIAATCVIFLQIFGGVFVSLENIPKGIAWLKYFSWFFYENEILQINQWTQAEIGCRICGTDFFGEDCEEANLVATDKI